LSGPEKFKRPNLAIRSFKKGQIKAKIPSKKIVKITNLEFHKMLEICSDLFKTCLKIYYFCQHSKKAKKWPNGQTILFLANSFKKGQICQIWPLKRPNGNPEWSSSTHSLLFWKNAGSAIDTVWHFRSLGVKEQKRLIWFCILLI